MREGGREGGRGREEEKGEGDEGGEGRRRGGGTREGEREGWRGRGRRRDEKSVYSHNCYITGITRTSFVPYRNFS